MFKIKGRDNIAAKYLICLSLSLLILISLSLLGALLLSRVKDPLGNIGICGLACLIISAALGAAVSAIIAPGRPLPFYMLVGLGCTLIMLLSSLIFFGGASLGAFMNYLCYEGAFILLSLLSARKKGRRRK